MIYLDSSAVVKLVIAEDESDALRRFLATARRRASSEILLTEAMRAVRRREAERDSEAAEAQLAQLEAILDGFHLWRLDRHVLTEASRIEPLSLRALDALHIACALQMPPLDAFISYDARQLRAAARVGLPTASPGAA